MNDGLISIIIFWGQGFIVKHWRTPFLWDFIHALSIAQLTDRVQHSLIRLKRWRIAPCLLIWGITQKSPVLYFLNSVFRISGSTKSICFLCELIDSSVNQPPQPCCVDLNGRSINCESRFDTSIPARSIFGHGDWINVFPSKFSIAIVMFWFSWKFLFGHNNNVQILYFQR